MRITHYLIALLLILPKIGLSQEYKKLYLSASIGHGFIDGILPANRIPTLGLGMEKELSKYLSLGGRIYSYYGKYPDTQFTENYLGYPFLDIIVEGAHGPFVTNDDIEKIKTTGIKYIKSDQTIKEYRLPIVFNLTTYPLQFKKHRLGIIFGLGISYNSANFDRPFTHVFELTLNDGSIYKDILLSVPTEFRNIDLIENIALLYEYRTDDIKLGARFGECGYLIGSYAALNWEAAIYVSLKL